MELGSDDVDASIVWVRSWSSRCGWNIKIIFFFYFYEMLWNRKIGMWFIDDLCGIMQQRWSVMLFECPDMLRRNMRGQDGGGSGKEAMWPDVVVGYWIWSYSYSVWRLPVKGRPGRIWNLMKSEARDAHRWITSVSDLSSRVCNRSRCGWVRFVSWVGVLSLGIHQRVDACKLELKSPH